MRTGFNERAVGKIVAVSTSEKRGQKKKNVKKAELKEDHGIIGDAHYKEGDIRQVSLLAIELMQDVIAKGFNVSPGDFAENITTEGIPLHKLSVCDKLQIGNDVVLEVTQIGKECKEPCAVYKAVGDCIMPKTGIFTKVLKGGVIFPKDEIRMI